MVVKQHGVGGKAREMFESRAVLDGSQTPVALAPWRQSFESRAVLDGSQTGSESQRRPGWFESRAVLDGSQTERNRSPP